LDSETLYKAAKYIRLSYTDDKTTESDSVANQRKILDIYIANQPDIEAVAEWVDDGVFGILFDRPAFKKIMADIAPPGDIKNGNRSHRTAELNMAE